MKITGQQVNLKVGIFTSQLIKCNNNNNNNNDKYYYDNNN